MNKHVNSYHCNVFFKIEKVNYPLKEDEGPSKERLNISSNSVYSFLVARRPFKKDGV